MAYARPSRKGSVIRPSSDHPSQASPAKGRAMMPPTRIGKSTMERKPAKTRAKGGPKMRGADGSRGRR